MKYPFIFTLCILCFWAYGFHAFSAKIGTYEEYEKLPRLAFTATTQQEFDRIAPWRADPLPAIETQDNYFVIRTRDGPHRFKRYQDDGAEKGWNGYELLGHDASMDVYILTENTSSEGIGFGRTFLLDGKTGKRTTLASFGEGSVSIPLLSPQKTHMVYYYNTDYQHKNADIGVLQIKNGTLAPLAGFHSDDFAIEEIRWKNENSFYVKGYEEKFENGKWKKYFRYYKTILPKSETGNPS